MARMQRKCVIASVGIHALLLMVLLVGPAFFRPMHRDAQESEASFPLLQFVQVPVESEPTPSTAFAPALTPAVSQPSPGVVRSDPVSTPMAPHKDWSIDQLSAKPRISTNLVVRNRSPRPGPRSMDQHTSADQFFRAVDNLFQGLSSATSILADGASGTRQGNSAYSQIVKAIYDKNWDPIGFGVSGETKPATARVVIGNDGRIISAEIIDRSGDLQMDQSVQRTLQQVKTIEPFEPAAREAQRSYVIKFDVRAR